MGRETKEGAYWLDATLNGDAMKKDNRWINFWLLLGSIVFLVLLILVATDWYPWLL